MRHLRYSERPPFWAAGHARKAWGAAQFENLVVLGRGTRFMGVRRVPEAKGGKRAEVPF